MNGEVVTRTAVPSVQVTSPFVLWARGFSLVLLLAGIGIFLFVTVRPVTVLPRITLAPGFALVNQENEQVTSEDMRGKITLYTFTYTDCEHCGQTAVMEQVAQQLSSIETNDVPVSLVTIFVDPEHDTPAELAAYASEFESGSALWQFLTGTAERLKWVVGGGFSVYYKTDDPANIKLDPAFMLVDGGGILRAEYRTAVPDIDIILRDIGLLAKEAVNRDGAAKYAYEAAHLFLCYPR